MSDITTYVILSPEPEPRQPVRISIEHDPGLSDDVQTAVTYHQFPDDPTTIYPSLQDLVRLGRLADAILHEREPSRRNYDEKHVVTQVGAA